MEIGGVALCHIVRALEAVVVRRSCEAPVIHTAGEDTCRIDDDIRVGLTEGPFVGVEIRRTFLEEVRAAGSLEGSLLRESTLPPALATNRLNAPYIGRLRLQVIHSVRVRRYCFVEDKCLFVREIRIGRNLKQIAAGGVDTVPSEIGINATDSQSL